MFVHVQIKTLESHTPHYSAIWICVIILPGQRENPLFDILRQDNIRSNSWGHMKVHQSSTALAHLLRGPVSRMTEAPSLRRGCSTRDFVYGLCRLTNKTASTLEMTVFTKTIISVVPECFVCE